MAYILTETDLDALQQAGITGVPAGVEATPEEMRILGVLDPALTDSFAMGDTTGTDVTGMTPDPNYQNGATPTAPLPQQDNSQPAGGFGALDILSSPPEQDFSYLEDPYSNLSKTQRRMLAFSAIKDAGMALQGKEGNSYATMLADITARADMARKAKAAQQQQAMMSTMFAGGVANLTPEQAIQYVAMGILPPEVLAFLRQEQDAQKEAKTAALGSVDAIVSAQTALGKIDAIFELLDSGSLPTTGWFGALTAMAGGGSAASQIASLNSSLQSQMSLDALKDLKSQGATLGGTSEGEITLLAASISELDPTLGRDTYMAQLRLVKDRYQQITNRIMNITDEDERALINKALGYDFWAEGSAAPSEAGNVIRFDAEGNPI